jgi:hypothetical protein
MKNRNNLTGKTPLDAAAPRSRWRGVAPAALALALFSLIPIQGQPPAPSVRGAPIGAAAGDGATNAAAKLGGGAAALVSTNAATAKAAKPGGPAGYIDLGFETLSQFQFQELEEVMDGRKDPATASRKTAEQIPAGIKALDEKNIALTGFMVPLKLEEGRVTEFMLVQNQMSCCYGAVPRINEWVTVRVGGKGVKLIMDEPVVVRGKLHVGGIRENGYLTGIYRLDGDKLLAADAK